MKRVLRNQEPNKEIVTIRTLLLWVSSPSPSIAQQALQGDWIGGIKIGNETLSLKAHFETQDESVTITSELSGQQSSAPNSIKWLSNRMHFEIPGASGLLTFEGEIKDGVISGEARQDNARGTFHTVGHHRLTWRQYASYSCPKVSRKVGSSYHTTKR